MIFRIFSLFIVVFSSENNGYRLPSNTLTELIPICVPYLSDYDNCTVVGECEDCIRCVCNSSRSWECTRLQKCQDNLKLMDTADSYVLGNFIDDDQGLEKDDIEISRRRKRDTLANTIAMELNDTSDENLDEIFHKNKSGGLQNQILTTTEKPVFREDISEAKSTSDSGQTTPKANEIKTEPTNRETKDDIQAQKSSSDSTRREFNEIDKKTIENEMEENEIKIASSNNKPEQINIPFEISAHEKMKGLLKNKSLKDEYKKLSHTIAYEMKPGVEFIGDRSVQPSVNINFKLVSGQTSSAHFAGALIDRIWDLLQNGLPEDSLKQAIVQNMGTLMNYSNEDKLGPKVLRNEPGFERNIERSRPEEVVIKYITGETDRILHRVDTMESKLENHMKNDQLNNLRCCENVQSKTPDKKLGTTSCESCRVEHTPNVRGENINVFFKVDSKDFFGEIPGSNGSNTVNSNRTNSAQEVLQSLLQDKSWISFMKMLKPLISDGQNNINIKNVADSNEASVLIGKINKLMEVFNQNTGLPKIDTSKFKVVLETEEKIRNLMRRDGSGVINVRVRSGIETLLNTLHSNLKSLLISSLEITGIPKRDNVRSGKVVPNSYKINLKTQKDIEIYKEAVKCIGNILDLVNTPNSGVIFKLNEILDKLNNAKHQENKISSTKTYQSPLDLAKRSTSENKNSNDLLRNHIVKNLTENIDKTIDKISGNLIENDVKVYNRKMLKKEDILRHILINKIKRKSKM